MSKISKSGKRSAVRTVVPKRVKTKTKAKGPKAAALADPGGTAAAMGPLLDQMEALVAGLAAPDSSKVNRLAQGAKYGKLLVPEVIVAMTSYPLFQKKGFFDVAAGQEALDYSSQLNPVTKRLLAVVLALAYSSNEKMAGAGRDALLAYKWAKGHASQPEGAAARPFVNAMARAVEIAGGRKHKTKTPADTPAPVPPTPAPAMHGFLAGSLANAAAVAKSGKANASKAKVKAKKLEELDDDELLDLALEAAKAQ
jgi:hypothetical protein